MAMIIKALSESEQLKLLGGEYTNDRNLAIVRLLVLTGMRVGELCKVRTNNVESGYIVLPASVTKSKRERVIPMNQAAIAAWNSLVFNPIFIIRRDRQWDNRLVPLSVRRIQQIVKNFRSKVNIPFPLTPHKLRHTFATRLMERKVSLRVIQELLGHASIATTQIYCSVSIVALRDAVNVL